MSSGFVLVKLFHSKITSLEIDQMVFNRDGQTQPYFISINPVNITFDSQIDFTANKRTNNEQNPRKGSNNTNESSTNDRLEKLEWNKVKSLIRYPSENSYVFVYEIGESKEKSEALNALQMQCCHLKDYESYGLILDGLLGKYNRIKDRVNKKMDDINNIHAAKLVHKKKVLLDFSIVEMGVQSSEILNGDSIMIERIRFKKDDIYSKFLEEMQELLDGLYKAKK